MSNYEKSYAEQIIDILRETHTTVKNLSEILDVSENIVRTTINRMKKKDLIVETNLFRNHYKVYRLGNLNEIKTDKLSEIDREILKRMLLPFARKGIKMGLTPELQKRVRELFSQTYNSKGERINGS